MLCMLVSQMGMREASDAFCKTLADYSFIFSPQLSADILF